MSGPSGDLTSHSPWRMDIEKVIVDAFSDFKKEFPPYSNLQGRYTFAVRCGEDQTKKVVQEACFPLLTRELLERGRPEKPLMIFALGSAVMKCLGFKFGKYTSIRGKFLRTKIEGRDAIVLASFSKRELLAKTGYYDVLQQHIRLFMDNVMAAKQGRDIATVTPPEELAKNYIFPETVEEVRKLVEMVIDYSRPGVDPANHVISIDTETNTLNPHRGKLKILTLVVAWDVGLAASIPVEHADSPWTLEDVRPYLAKLLQCKKPKVFHNGKYDLKVLYKKGFGVKRFAWDTMIGEHLLSEDKKGNYGLKALVGVNLPKYADYDDELDKIRKQIEAETKTDTALKGAAKKLAEDDGFGVVPLKTLNIYGAIDADVTRQMCTVQRRRVAAENKQIALARKKLATNQYFRSVAKPGSKEKDPLTRIMLSRSTPISRVLADMELYGTAVDREYLSDLAYEMDATILELHMQLQNMIKYDLGVEFNPNSGPQIEKILFTYGYHAPDAPEGADLIVYNAEELEGHITYTDTGRISVNATFLKFLRNTHKCQFADALLKYRAVTKARNTFITNIDVLSRETGRMHTSFHIIGTSTGRLSSSDENMQNIPKYIGKHNIKKIFVPTDRENDVIVNADAKAAEVRIYAAYSGDENLTNALNDGMDPHSFFASTVYNPESVLSGIKNRNPQKEKLVLKTIGIDLDHPWSYDDFQNRDNFTGKDEAYGKQLDNLRKNIKRVVFGILYGAGKGNIANIVGITHEQAKAIIDVLFRMFPTIPKYINMTKEQVRHLGVVETLIGRRRRFQIRGMTHYQRAKAERQAVNFKIQSTSSDIVLGVINEVDGPIRELGGRMLITVHDSLVLELPKKYVHQMPDFMHYYGVKRVAEQYPWLPVPFQWDVEVGPSYGELVGVDKYLKNVLQFDTTSDLDELEVRQEFTALGS